MDDTEWDKVLEASSPTVFGTALRLTRNHHDAEDLAQEALFRAFTHVSSFVPGNFDAWMTRITTNLFLDRLRRARRRPPTVLLENHEDRLGSDHPSPEQLFLDRLLSPDVSSALADLHQGIRDVVLLRDVHGFTNTEIAAVLDVSESTVGTRLHRGHQQLRRALSQRGAGSGQ